MSQPKLHIEMKQQLTWHDLWYAPSWAGKLSVDRISDVMFEGGAMERQWLYRGFQFLTVLIMGMMMGGVARAQILEVPIDVQVPLFLKATTYDRAFAGKLSPTGTMRVGICYQEKNRISAKEMEELKAALTGPNPGFKIEIVPMAIADGEDVSKRKEWGKLSAIYITSMRGFDVATLLAKAQETKVLSVCTNPSLAQKGVTMSFELVASRPKFVINRNSAAAEGCDFSSQLLKLATIY
jgi:hypothetical protein